MRTQNHCYSSVFVYLAGVCVALCLSTQAQAQTTLEPRPALSRSPMPGVDRVEFEIAFAELRQLVEAQGAEIQRQARIIESQGRDRTRYSIQA